MPPLAFRTVAKVAAAESNRSINAYEGLRPSPDNVKAPIELPADAKVTYPQNLDKFLRGRSPYSFDYSKILSFINF